jgi:uncharacterized protein with ParB-like and HNH nuclease domain
MISPEKQTIEQILGGTRVKYSVPSYQRSYDWGKGELQELIDDLKQLKGDKEKELFLGNFIFDVSDGENYNVVDGQQRLTTISILFIALREHAKKLNELEIAAEIQKYISIYSKIRGKNEIKFNVSQNIKDVYEMMANPEWDGQFVDKIESKPVKRQVNKIKPIYSYIIKELAEYNSTELKEFINGLWDTYVIVIQVESTQDVFAVFERTNARGLDLNIGDLLKNYIFSYQQDGFEDKWAEIIENANGGLPRMLKYFWVSRKGYIQQSNLYREIKNYVKEIDGQNNQEGIKIFVKELYAFSRYYKVVQSLDPEQVRDWLEEIGLTDLAQNEDYYARIARVFQALKLFRVTQSIPVIYSIFRLYVKKESTKFDWLLNSLEAIEKYHFVNNVVSGRVGHEVENFYAETANRLYNSKEDFVAELTRFKNDLSKKRALRDEFSSNFVDSIVYNTSNIGLINYVFDRINNYKVKGSQYVPIYSPEKDLKKRNYNIEHILAQNHKAKFTEEEQEKFDQIGNLIVISRHTNSQLQDLDPKDKVKLIESDKKHFGNLRYMDDFLNDYKADLEDWNFDSIDKRSENMAKMAFEKIWQF